MKVIQYTNENEWITKAMYLFNIDGRVIGTRTGKIVEEVPTEYDAVILKE